MYRLEQDEHAVWHIRGRKGNECVACIEPDVYMILRELLRAEFQREAEAVVVGERGGPVPGS